MAYEGGREGWLGLMVLTILGVCMPGNGNPSSALEDSFSSRSANVTLMKLGNLRKFFLSFFACLLLDVTLSGVAGPRTSCAFGLG